MHRIPLVNRGGFDQVPVVDEQKKLIGLVTVGNLLSKIAQNRAKSSDNVTKVMFTFNTSRFSLSLYYYVMTNLFSRPFTEITPDTKLADLEKFFEKNSAAFVTEKDQKTGISVVKHVVTKVDLLKYLLSAAN
jgi:cystathionine beta-synthase